MSNATTNTPPPPSGGGTQPKKSAIDQFLSAFKRKKKTQTAAPIQPPPKSPNDAFNEDDWTTLQLLIAQGEGTKADRDLARKLILQSEKGIAAMVANRALAVAVLSSADPRDLRDGDLFEMLGKHSDDIVADTLLALASKHAPNAAGDADMDRTFQMDPKLFKLLSDQVGKDVWNDTNLGLGQKKRGLGPRVFNRLLAQKGFDQILNLIDKGVDTTIPALTDDAEPGAYSGFVMPLQHKLQAELPRIAKLDTDESKGWSASEISKAQGMKAILDKLEKAGKADMLTSYDQVKKSEMIAEFEKNPGTIWGFENVRETFVQAAHGTAEGGRPVRMMELWDAVVDTLTAKAYAEFLEDPTAHYDKLVDAALKLASEGIDAVNQNPDTTNKQHVKFKPVRHKKDEYLKNLKADAHAFLREFASQMPRGSMSRVSQDVSSPDPKLPMTVSNVAGVDFSKFMSSFACMAGLWNAKNEGKPVYYILDGIKMDDVVDYKKAKYKAIEEYLSAGGAGQSQDTFKEVVTMKEVREILRNWDDLKFPDGKDVVKFVRKGTIMKPDEVKKFVAEWQQKMAAANKAAGRRPAPGRVPDPQDPSTKILAFSKELAAIDPGLPAKLDARVKGGADEKTVDMDARDIVRKAGYLLRVSNTNPEYVVKYLMAKCDILVAYDLVPGELVTVAADFGKLAYARPPASKSALKAPAEAIKKALQKCADQFRGPLARSLIKHPILEHSKRMEKMAQVA